MNRLVNAWYRGSPWLSMLKPLSFVFQNAAERRRDAYRSGKKAVYRAPVPLLVVGNITVGGVGKTPLTAALANHFKQAGFQPGIISRGYGSRAPTYPFSVTVESAVEQAGDEPYMLARQTGCPLIIDPDRTAAARFLLDNFDCDLIISDDGLQHYALGRDLEIAVVDGQRQLGNGLCLPAGPLREPEKRLTEVDWVVVNGGPPDSMRAGWQRMVLKPTALVNLATGARMDAAGLVDTGPVHAVAGIGNPSRFFKGLRGLGYRVQEHAFADHYRYLTGDLDFGDDKVVIMTEKDAVKCAAMGSDRCWYLQVTAQLDQAFVDSLIARVKQLAG